MSNSELLTIIKVIASPEALIAIALSVFVIVRFFVTLKQGLLDLNRSHVRQAWLMWGVYFCIASGSILLFVNKRLTQWHDVSTWLIETWIAVLGYILTSGICINLTQQRWRWNWPLVAGLLVSVNAWLSDYWLKGALGPRLSDLGFSVFVLVVCIRLVIPSFYWAYRHETQSAIRLRFLIMTITHLGVTLWMTNTLLTNISLIFGITYNQEPLYIIALLICAPSFLIAYLMPASYFVRLIIFGNYLTDLITLIAIRQLERNIARYAQAPLCPLSIQEIIVSPGTAVFRSSIAIFDERKRLALVDNPLAKQLAQSIEQLARPDLAYPQIIRRLRQIWVFNNSLLRGALSRVY